jgi:acyl-CoA oxidase
LQIIGNNLSTFYVISMASPIVSQAMAESNRMAKEHGKFDSLESIHHYTSGFKALCTNYAASGIDELRQACGGAGYSLASGISALWLDTAPNTTFEGVNVVMMKESSRYLLK